MGSSYFFYDGKTMTDINELCFAKPLNYINDSNLIIPNLLLLATGS